MPRSRRNRRIRRGGMWPFDSPTVSANGQAPISPNEEKSWYSGFTDGVSSAFNKIGEYTPSFGTKKGEIPVNSTDQYGQPNSQYGQTNGQYGNPTGGYRRSRRFRGGQVTLPPVGDGIVLYRKSRRRRR